VDVRLVAATNRDLEAEVHEGRFREDLLYRINVVEIKLKPLREYPEDIPLLVEFFLDKHVTRLGRSRPSISQQAMASLVARRWPGNVRELENAVERAIVLAEGDALAPGDFGPASGEGEDGPSPPPGDLKGAARAAAAEAERKMIRAALDQTDGNVTRAAETLGLSRRGLQLKMKELDLR
jgi:DNA-binding NtrC family response regulator